MNKNELIDFFMPAINEVVILTISIIAILVISFFLIKNRNTIKIADKLLTWTFICHYSFLLLWQIGYLIEFNKNELIENLLAIIVLMIMIIIGIKSFVVVKHNKMGIRITLGEPGEHLKSGPHIAIWPIQIIAIVPTELQSITAAANSIMTKRGRVMGYQDIIESAEISVLFTIYYLFDQEKLAETIKVVSGFTEADLAVELIPYTVDVLRTLIGRTPWRLINEERFKFTQCALGRIYPISKSDINFKIVKKAVTSEGKFIEENEKTKKQTELFLYEFEKMKADDPDWLGKKQLAKSPFVQFGLTKIMITIEDINFTNTELREAISAPELSRLKKDAQKLDAEAQRYTIEQKGIAEAEARRRMMNVIKENPDLEVLYTLREMAQGTSNTLFYQLPSGVESKLRDMLGGNSPGDLTKFLSPEMLKQFKDMIEAAVKTAQK